MSEESFLPRILSIFYAVLDVRQGPKIQFQVPEDLIAPAREQSSFANSFSPPSAPLQTPVSENYPESRSFSFPTRNASPTLAGDTESPRPRNSPASKKQPTATTPRTLFYFEDVSRYVIPSSALCGRLVKCTTQHHRIIGFPVELLGTNYDRREFRFNVCFVFDKSADLSCYEPLVRKVGRVLTACEEESSFLSSPQTASTMLSILEQLYEDLGSYAETAIPVDQFNSIELKLLPFYPNPRAVKDWHVPVPLIDLKRTREPHWDLTVSKVCDYIDGVNHISRIAALADCDADLAREAISHLLYYQVILISDIFAYSNMYTMRKSIQWLAVAPHVVGECGPYIMKPGRIPPEWPQLLHMYARLRPGLTVSEWIQELDVHMYGIDVRRFLSFGMIKGFIRRVHRYPILLPNNEPKQAIPMPMSPSTTNTSGPTSPVSTTSRARPSLTQSLVSPQHSSVVDIPTAPAFGITRAPKSSSAFLAPLPADGITAGRRSSAAEKALERVFHQNSRSTSPAPPTAPPSSPLMKHGARPRGMTHDEHMHAVGQPKDQRRPAFTPSSLLSSEESSMSAAVESTTHSRRRSGSDNLGRPIGAGLYTSSLRNVGRRTSSRPPIHTSSDGTGGPWQGDHSLTTSRVSAIPPFYRSGSTGEPVTTGDIAFEPPPPKELEPLLDGEMHTDEMCTRFQVGWPRLARWLQQIGGGQGDGDFGRVLILYR